MLYTLKYQLLHSHLKHSRTTQTHRLSRRSDVIAVAARIYSTAYTTIVRGVSQATLICVNDATEMAEVVITGLASGSERTTAGTVLRLPKGRESDMIGLIL